MNYFRKQILREYTEQKYQELLLEIENTKQNKTLNVFKSNNLRSNILKHKKSITSEK